MKTTHFSVLRVLLVCMALGLSACSTAPVAMKHSPEFAPVLPVAVQRPREASGAIFNGRHSDNFFGRSSNYRVGDLITVVLKESSQANRIQEGNVNRTSTNDVIPKGLTTAVSELSLPTKIMGTTLDGVMKGVDLSKATVDSKGVAGATQNASMEGQVTVTVVEVLANGNLMVRGEKQLAFTEGSEIIQVSGILRPSDISPNNMVLSRRLANAQISYRGTGDMANAAKAGWGTSALLKLWPF